MIRMSRAAPVGAGRWVMFLTVSLALIVAWDLSGADLVVSRWVGSPDGFHWRDHWLIARVFHDGGRWLSMGWLSLLAWDAWRPLLDGPSRRRRAYAVAVILLTALLVPAIKRMSATSCPWDLAEFGGLAVYLPHWMPGGPDGGAGRCFPSGHAVAGFAFVGAFPVWYRDRPASAHVWLAIALGLGLLFGATQVLRGAHYVSHVLWSAWLCVLMAALGDGLATHLKWLRRYLEWPVQVPARNQRVGPEERLMLDRADQAATKMMNRSMPLPQAGLGQVSSEGQRMRVLLVEDEVSLALGLQVALRSDHYTVDIVHDGSSALHALSQEDFDVLVLDLGLPKMDGLQVLRELRRRNNAIPVLVLTARDATADRIAGLDAGADDYLIKPFEVGELQARLRALFRRRGARASPLMKVGDVTLDPATRVVTCRGRQVSLGRREFMLLHQLMAQPGRVLTRDRLEQGLYGWNEEAAESNALEVHIHHLRRKLDPDFIRTVRGIGYRVEPS